MAGIAQWPIEGGNHTWVEVWDNGWHYIEASEQSEYDNTWFSARTKDADPDNPMTRIYAVSFEKTPLSFLMIWDYYNKFVYAENVTMRYKNLVHEPKG